jgi:uncharacterized membrane protein YbaN (DUF454 family)
MVEYGGDMNHITRFKKWFFITVGTISVVLGFLGIVLPLLPTTPFLLLAAACYIRSSERFYNWLIYHKWFGSYIRNYREGRGISLTTKIIAITTIWLTIGYSTFFVVPLLLVKILLILIAISVTIYLLRIKTLQSTQRDNRTDIGTEER